MSDLKIHINGIIQQVVSCVWYLFWYQEIIFWESVVLLHVSIFCSIITECVYIWIYLCIYFWWTFGHFHFEAILNKVTLNICIYIFWETYSITGFGEIPRSEIAGLYRRHMLNFIQNWQKWSSLQRDGIILYILQNFILMSY